ncbi:MAG: Fic family protein [Verrucomicrobia bacterium]|nr:Fic family protein [Verrucomicrobiota bacterium]
MKIAPHLPTLLPIKKLDGSSLLRAVGEAREALARFDEELRKSKKNLFERFLSFDLSELENYDLARDGYLLAEKWVRGKKGFNGAFFCALHKTFKGGSGKFREEQNWIGPHGKSIDEAYYLPPTANRVPALMKNLSTYLSRKTEEPLVQLAIAFAQLLIIHPFMDGNGRVARALVPAFLWKRKLISKPYFFLSRYIRAHRLAYYQKLYDISEESEWEEWILFFLRGIKEEAEIPIGER